MLEQMDICNPIEEYNSYTHTQTHTHSHSHSDSVTLPPSLTHSQSLYSHSLTLTHSLTGRLPKKRRLANARKKHSVPRKMQANNPANRFVTFSSCIPTCFTSAAYCSVLRPKYLPWAVHTIPLAIPPNIEPIKKDIQAKTWNLWCTMTARRKLATYMQ